MVAVDFFVGELDDNEEQGEMHSKSLVMYAAFEVIKDNIQRGQDLN